MADFTYTPEQLQFVEAVADNHLERLEEAFNDYGYPEIAEFVFPQLGVDNVEDLTEEQEDQMTEEIERLFYTAIRVDVDPPGTVVLDRQQLDILAGALGDWVEGEQELAVDDAEFYDPEGIKVAQSALAQLQAALVRLTTLAGEVVA